MIKETNFEEHISLEDNVGGHSALEEGETSTQVWSVQSDFPPENTGCKQGSRVRKDHCRGES